MAKTVLISRDTVYQFLTKLSNFPARSNYKTFVLVERQGGVKKLLANKIKVDYVTSVGSSYFTIQKYVESLNEVKESLEKYFNTTTEFKDSDQKRKLYIPQPSDPKTPIVIDFSYKNISSSGKEENEGQRYEVELIDKLRTAGYTSQTKAEELNPKQDITVTVNGVSAGIEVKSNWKAAFGQARLEYVNNSWQLKSNASEVIKKLVENEKLLPWINQNWNVSGSEYTPKSNPDKKDQEKLGGGTGYFINVSNTHIKEYYSGSDYIHIRDKGFYRIGTDNPLKIGQGSITNFEPTKSKARIRVKNVGSGRYDYVIEMYLGELPLSVNRIGLDGDLSFLGTP